MNLRQITHKDQLDLKKVYFESIQSIDGRFYSQNQKRAWSSQAWDNANFEKSLREGRGWVIDEGIIVAFAIRYPEDRISLLYCRSEFQRKGYGTKLILKLEQEAREEGIKYLTTEASLISYRLFLKNNWEILRKEKIIIKNYFFQRYKMFKNLEILN